MKATGGMPVIELETVVKAPVEVVFDLARSIDLHSQSTAKTRERAVDGRTSGLIEFGETVTWEATHFGVRQRLTSDITAFDRPRHFRDTMLKGAFAKIEHDHYFEPAAAGTRMVDRFDFTSPLGPLGKLADWLFLKRYMTRFIGDRNEFIKTTAEGGDFARYLPARTSGFSLQTGNSERTEAMQTFLDAGSHLPVKTFEEGEVVMHEDRKDGAIYILKRGVVEVQKRQTTITTIASPGAVLGEVSVLLDRPHTATIIAEEPCEFLVAEDGEQFLRDHPELNLQVSRMLANRLQLVTVQLVELQERIEATTDVDDEGMSGIFRTLLEHHHF
ncbi:MAG: CRP-like cAMP-binding protein/ligand-binding SRPBCC domain-containing protein [Verrucomicrobiales bacterium]|jgi:CRP-like cAMP-binding protein/ligand-binding SRPBCC domain-containing protein